MGHALRLSPALLSSLCVLALDKTEILRPLTSMALEWTEDELPFALTDIDRAHLRLTDDEFEPHTWDQLKTIVGALASRVAPPDSLPRLPLT